MAASGPTEPPLELEAVLHAQGGAEGGLARVDRVRLDEPAASVGLTDADAAAHASGALHPRARHQLDRGRSDTRGVAAEDGAGDPLDLPGENVLRSEPEA